MGIGKSKYYSFLNKYCVFFYVVFLFLCVPWIISAEEPIMRFKQISLDQGLSNNFVYCALRDSRGFMWFGTECGLNRYDGYEFLIYKHDQSDLKSLSNNTVRAIIEDEQGNLWLGTADGLNKYDNYTKRFKHFLTEADLDSPYTHTNIFAVVRGPLNHLWIGCRQGLILFNTTSESIVKRYTHDALNPESLPNDAIKVLYKDRDDNLWIGTREGVAKLKQGTDNFEYYSHDPENPCSISDNRIQTICQDHQGMIWVGTWHHGLNKLNPETGRFKRYIHDPEDKYSLSENQVEALWEDSQKRLWVGTWRKGLNYYDRENDCFIHYQTDPFKPNTLNSNSIENLYEDYKKNLWICTSNGGVNWVDQGVKEFHIIQHDPLDPTSLNNNIVYAVYENQRGDLWVGTLEKGLNLRRQGEHSFHHFISNAENSNHISSNEIKEIVEYPKNRLWIGTIRGLNQFDTNTENFTVYLFNKQNPKNVENIIYDIEISQEGFLWIGTAMGIIRFNPITGEYIKYYNNPERPNTLNNKGVLCILEDRHANLWAGTYFGLFVKPHDQEDFIHYESQPEDSNSLSHDYVFSIHEDATGTIWVATSDGLNQFNPITKQFKHYYERHGLPNSMIVSLLEDNHGQLWIGTAKGLSRFDLKKKTFTNYYKQDGLPSNEFIEGSAFKNTEGRLYFGTINGLVGFVPDSIKKNSVEPPVYITNFSIFNQPVTPEKKINNRIILDTCITETRSVTLHYDENIINFEFIALNLTDPEKNQYAYKLKGLEKSWNYIGNRHFANYTNLSPGKYTFQVKASNNDGIWNTTGASLNIIITPPFWQTWWFKMLMILFIFAIIYTVYKLRIRSIEAQKKKLEVQVEERTKEIKNQKDIIEQKNEHILSSIRYGERIQNAILPLTEKIRSSLPEHFIFYKPRDIVSGDFYWFNKTNGKTVLAVVDCTGHGVPGAFMSMLGNAFLNDIIVEQKILNPALILKHLHKEVRFALKQEQETINLRDGMDVCLCVLEKNSHNYKLEFAGAKRPLYINKKGETELIEIKGDRISIGGRQREEERTFTDHEFEIKSGDNLYLATDGFADQQNPRNRRYGSGRLKSLLHKISDLEIGKQQQVLVQELAKHQGKEEQRDDITVVGVKL